MSDQERLHGEVRDPEGRVVVLLARIWDDKIARDHPELQGQLEPVLETVSAPDHVERDPQPDRRRYYRRKGVSTSLQSRGSATKEAAAREGPWELPERPPPAGMEP